MRSSGACARCTLLEIACSGPQPTPQRMAKRQAKANNLHTHRNRDTSPTSASSSSTVPASPSDTQDSVCSDFSDLLSSEQRYTDFLNYVSPVSTYIHPFYLFITYLVSHSLRCHRAPLLQWCHTPTTHLQPKRSPRRVSISSTPTWTQLWTQTSSRRLLP